MDPTTKHFRKRDAILSFLRRTKEHPSAETVYEMVRLECPDISRASVYRNLTLFKEQGLILSLGTVDGVERFDGRVDPHVHFACKSCGSIADVMELTIPEHLSSAAQSQLLCRVDDVQLMLSGVCQNCLKK